MMRMTSRSSALIARSPHARACSSAASTIWWASSPNTAAPQKRLSVWPMWPTRCTGRMVMAQPNDIIWAVFMTTGLDKVFEFTPDVPTALAKLQMGL